MSNMFMTKFGVCGSEIWLIGNDTTDLHIKWEERKITKKINSV